MKNVIILGSGRSGTSMITGAISKNGFFLGDNADYLGSNKSNPKGFFEDYEVNTINEDILKETIPFTIPEKIRKKYFKSFTFYRARWLLKLPNYLTLKSTKTIILRIERVLKNNFFCFKDPRFCYTLPIWLPYLNKDTRFIVVYREPYKTAISIVRECKEKEELNNFKMNYKQALQVWYSMYNHVLKTYNNFENKDYWFFIHYDDIFNDSKVKDLEYFIKGKIDLNFAEKKYNRTKDARGKVSKRINKIYIKLQTLSGN